MALQHSSVATIHTYKCVRTSIFWKHK